MVSSARTRGTRYSIDMDIWVAVISGVFMLAGVVLTAAFQFRQLRHDRLGATGIDQLPQTVGGILGQQDMVQLVSCAVGWRHGERGSWLGICCDVMVERED